MERGRALAAELCGDGRVLIQGHAVPDVGPLDAALASMAEVAAAHDLSAWKVYTHAPNGFFLDDHDPSAPAVGAPFLQTVRATGVPVVAVHKGLSGGNRFASPVDIGPAAAANPDLSFLVYHSGYEAGGEGPYDPDGTGVDRLVRSVGEAGIGPGGNVYAELGSTWRNVMGSPDDAAHVLGKLLVAFGPERILWGTDSIWYGSPQDQIAAFRAFEITPAFQERFGYPALTADVKRRILGANAVELLRDHAAGRRVRDAGRAGGPTADEPHARPGVAARHRGHVPARAPLDGVATDASLTGGTRVSEGGRSAARHSGDRQHSDGAAIGRGAPTRGDPASGAWGSGRRGPCGRRPTSRSRSRGGRR